MSPTNQIIFIAAIVIAWLASSCTTTASKPQVILPGTGAAAPIIEIAPSPSPVSTPLPTPPPIIGIPHAPTNLKAVYHISCFLNWIQSTDPNVTSYRVYQRNLDGTYMQVAEVPFNTPFATIYGLDYGTTYYFAVTNVYGGQGLESDKSPPIYFYEANPQTVP